MKKLKLNEYPPSLLNFYNSIDTISQKFFEVYDIGNGFYTTNCLVEKQTIESFLVEAFEENLKAGKPEIESVDHIYRLEIKDENNKIINHEVILKNNMDLEYYV